MKTQIGKNPESVIAEEKTPWHMNGMVALVLNIMLMLGSGALVVAGGMMLDAGWRVGPGIASLVAGSLYLCLVGPVLFAGLKVLRPNEALVFTLFGSYHGCLRNAGFYFVNPFVEIGRASCRERV